MNLDWLVGIFGLLFFAALTVRVYVVYRQIGRLPVILNHADSAHDYVHKVIAGIIAFEGLNILLFRAQALHAFLSDNPERTFYHVTGPITALETESIQAFGLVLAYAGLLWSVIAQAQMGRDWRVGIDAKSESGLIRHGLYRISRHPIYLGFMTIALGLFFAVPNLISLTCAVLTVVVLSIEARLEEQFLASQKGDTYRTYLATTRRWI